MSNKDNDYLPFNAKRRGLFSSHRLFYNDIQLLLVDTGVVNEEYRRIAFADICGFTISDTKAGLTISIASSLVILIACISLAFGSLTNLFLWSLVVAMGMILFINIKKGRTSKCIVTTRFNRFPVKAITRQKKAFEFRDLLHKNIEPAQGLLTPIEIEELERSQRAEETKPENPSIRHDDSVDDSSISSEMGESDLGEIPKKLRLVKEEPSYPENVAEIDATTHAPPPVYPDAVAAPPLVTKSKANVGKSVWLFPISLLVFAICCVLYGMIDSFPNYISLLFFLLALGTSVYVIVIQSKSSLKTTSITSLVSLSVLGVVAYIAWMIGLLQDSMYDPYSVDSVVEQYQYRLPEFFDYVMYFAAVLFIGIASFAIAAIDRAKGVQTQN